MMLILKIYLFSGLIVHKLVWEILKNKRVDEPDSAGIKAVKSVKVALLVAILIQIWLPEVFPISEQPHNVRLIGTVLYTLGLVVAIIARIQLGDNWSNIETGKVLENQQVVSRGIYGYIRHPIYTGDLLVLLGLELALNSWLVLGVLLLAPVVLLKAIKEEQMLVRELENYGNYCQRTKRFIPFVI